MVPVLKLNKTAAALLASFGIFFSCYLIRSSHIFMLHSKLALALIFDLTVTFPLVNFLILRKTKYFKFVFSLLCTASFLYACLLLRGQDALAQSFFKIFFSAAEVGGLLFLVLRMKKSGKKSGYFSSRTDLLKSSVNDFFPPKVAAMVISELTVLYFCLLVWRKYVPLQNEFTNHKKSGASAILISFAFMLLAETSILHIIISRTSVLAANVLTITSVYSILIIAGIITSLPKKLTVIMEDRLILRYGILREVTIPFTNIQNIIWGASKMPEKNNTTQYLSPLHKLETYNIVILTKSNVLVKGLYGREKAVSTVIFNVDDRDRFKKLFSEKAEHKIL